MPTETEIRNVNKAMSRLCDQLDKFEMACVQNSMPLRAVHFVNKPKLEFSELHVIYRGSRGVRK